MQRLPIISKNTYSLKNNAFLLGKHLLNLQERFICCPFKTTLWNLCYFADFYRYCSAVCLYRLRILFIKQLPSSENIICLLFHQLPQQSALVQLHTESDKRQTPLPSFHADHPASSSHPCTRYGHIPDVLP